MKKAYEVSSCNFCHIGGIEIEDRKNRNAYGQALAKLLSKEDAEKLVFRTTPKAFREAEEKVRKAIEAVEKERSDPNDKGSPTFGDLLKAGKLPRSPRFVGPKE